MMTRRTINISIVLLVVSTAYADIALGQARNVTIPPQSVVVDPKSFAVLPNNFTFRTDSFTQLFNPTQSQEFPIFQIFNEAFLEIIGPSPSISEIASNSTFAFAHEAPIYVSDTDEVFFASNDGGPLGLSGINQNNGIFKLNLTEAERMLGSAQGGNRTVNVPITQVPLPDSIQMTNGGTGPTMNGDLILVNSGRGTIAPNIALVNPKPPNNVTVILNNYYGRQFNSLNDAKIHPTNGNLFFTDTFYGFIKGFRSGAPLIPGQVYRLDLGTGAVRVVADGIDKPNGIAFTADGKTAYVCDSGASGGNATEPSTIHAFDVDQKTQTFLNRRVLAYVDAGIPDGIEVDMNGNVYTACADGVQVFAPDGTLLGKFFTNMLGANMIFAGPGRLVILSETKVFLAKIAPGTKGVVS